MVVKQWANSVIIAAKSAWNGFISGEKYLRIYLYFLYEAGY